MKLKGLDHVYNTLCKTLLSKSLISIIYKWQSLDFSNRDKVYQAPERQIKWWLSQNSAAAEQGFMHFKLKEKKSSIESYLSPRHARTASP